MILTVVVGVTLGGGAYLFGNELLKIYTGEADVIACGLEILSITTVWYFLCGLMDLFPGSIAWHGTFGCADDPLDYWYGRHTDRMDLPGFSHIIVL